MVTDPPQRLVTAIVIALVVHVTSATAIPKLPPVSGGNESDAAEGAKQETSGPDQQPMVLKAETADGEEPVFIDFSSYADENKNEQRTRNDDLVRYSYNVIYDAPKANSPKLIPVDRPGDAENPTVVLKDAGENRKGSADGVDSVLQLNVREQIELEENLPGYHNWPKHIPDHLRPISPFPDDERVIAQGPSFVPGRQIKGEEAFLPSEKFQPPARAGPYLYPQSFVDREFRVPFY